MAGLGLTCLALGVAVVSAPATAEPRCGGGACRGGSPASSCRCWRRSLIGAIYLSDLDVRLARADQASSPQAQLESARSAERLNPLALPPRYLQASALESLGRRPAARRELLAALDREPKNFVTMALLGDLETRAGRPNRARAWYRRALALNPIDVGLRQLAARLTRVRVLFLTHYFPPEVGAPQTRIAALAQGLRERGIEVTVHTGFPNYPDGRIAPPYRNRPLQRERAADGTQDRAQRGLRRAQRRLRAAAGEPHELRGVGAADRAALRARRRRRGGVAAAVPGRGGGRLRPRQARAAGAQRRRPVARQRGRDRRALRRAARSPRRARWRSGPTAMRPRSRSRRRGWCERLEARPSAAGRAVHMPPAVDVERFAGLAPAPADGPLRVLYAGTIGLAHGLGTLLSRRAARGARHGRRDDRGRRCGGGGAAGAGRGRADRQRQAGRDGAGRADRRACSPRPTPGS